MKKKVVGIVFACFLIMSACANKVPNEIASEDEPITSEDTSNIDISSAVATDTDGKKIEEYLPVFSENENINLNYSRQ